MRLFSKKKLVATVSVWVYCEAKPGGVVGGFGRLGHLGCVGGGGVSCGTVSVLARRNPAGVRPPVSKQRYRLLSPAQQKLY